MSFVLKPQDIVKAISGDVHIFPEGIIDGISTDTRENCQQKLFFPLKGDYFDGHNYLQHAAQAGASCVVCQKDRSLPANWPKTVGVLYVKDSLKAYQNLAKTLRQTFKPKVLAITGSNGKTTTKAFLSTLLQAQYKVLASKASFNNHIGLPHTLLQIRPETEIVILEMGMNHLNEIKKLVMIADPDVAMVTTVGRSHLAGLQTIQNVAAAKEEIYKYSKKEAIRIFNLDNHWTKNMYKIYQNQSQTMTFSQHDKTADVYFHIEKANLDILKFSGTIQGIEGEVTLNLFGEHHLNNLMAASCGALSLGLPPSQIWTHLQECQNVWGRSQIVTLKNKSKVIFDAYNANPDSMQALFTHIGKCEIPGQCHICLGDMLELGPKSNLYHKELAQKVAHTISASQMKIGMMAFVGEFGQIFKEELSSCGFEKDIMLLEKYESLLATKMQSLLQPNDLVVIKASRGVQLEKLLEAISKMQNSRK